jgi:hypothetical protein
MKTNGLLLGGSAAVRRIVTGAAAGLALLVGAGACSTSSSSNDGSSCSEDDTIQCTAGATGWSCAAGDLRPDSTNSGLLCSEPTPVNGEDTYCCYDGTENSGGTCQQDFTIACPPYEYGFSCSGSDMPQNDYPNLATCDTEDNMSYCCSD